MVKKSVISEGKHVVPERELSDFVNDYSVDISYKLEDKRTDVNFTGLVQAFNIRQGDNFFNELAIHIQRLLKVDYVVFGQVIRNGKSHINSLAVCHQGDLIDPISYALKGTPCEKVMTRTVHSYSQSIQKTYPDFELLKLIDAESYVGAPLFDNQGSAIGILAVINTTPIKNIKTYESLINIFAVRAADELNRITREKELIKYKELIDASNDLMSVVNLDYEYVSVNKSYLEFFNKKSSEIIGHHVSELHGEEDFLNKIKPSLDKCFRGQRVKNYINKLKNDNSTAHISAIHNPYYSADGKVIGAVVIARDITESIQSKNEIEKYQNTIHQLYEIVAEPKLSFDEKVNNILQLCAGYLDMEIGIYGELTSNTYKIINLYNQSELPLEAGYELAREGSYCAQTAILNRPVALHHVGESEYAKLDLYKKMKLETYLGVPVVVNDSVYGTVCFINSLPKEKPFSESEIDLVKLAARWVTTEKQRVFTEKQQRKYQQALSISEQRQQSLIDLQPECVKRVSKSGEIIYMNAAGLAFIDADSLAKVAGSSIYELVTDEYKEKYIQLNERVFSGETVQMEYEIDGLKGKRRWMDTHARPVTDDGGTVIEHLAITRDITERKNAELKLHATTRALKVVNDCNYASTQVDTEEELLRRICEVIINTGGYRFSWIGYGQKDSDKTVKPIANAGHEDGYLNNKFTWGTTENGLSPAGTSIKEKKTCIVRNIMVEDIFKPWRDAALERGYASMVSLPIDFENESNGALMIYSSEQNSFDKAEVDLLTNLARNLSYAVRSIRTKEQKLIAEKILVTNEEKYRLLVEESGAIVWECSYPAFQFNYVSQAAEKILGYPVNDWYKKEFWTTHLHNEDKERSVSYCLSQTIDGTDHEFEYRMYKADGTIVWLHDVVHVVVDDNKKPISLRGLMIDITDKKQVENALQKSEERFSLAMQGASDGLWDWDMLTNDVYFSLRWKSMLGYEEDEVDNNFTSFKELLHPDDSVRTFAHVDDYISGKVNNFNIEFRMLNKQGSYIDILSRAFGVRNERNAVVRLVGMHSDITQRKGAEQALLNSENRFRTLYDDTPAVFFSVDQQGLILTINEFGANHLGYAVEELIGKDVHGLSPDDSRVAAVEKMLSCFNSPDEIKRWDCSMLTKKGDVIQVRKSARVVDDLQGQPSLFIVSEDVSETYRLSEELKYQASHDSLTTLVNRREFEKRLERVLIGNSIRIPGHAVCYLDLDNFKIINDTCGHLAGDAMLKQLSMLLASSMRARDTLARLGGDEFGILMENCSLKQASSVAQKILEIVEDFKFVWGENKFSVGVSIGLVPINEVSGSVVDILSAADNACYVAKESGRNRVHVFSPGDDELEKRRGEMQWVARISHALDENLFCLFYQEVIPCKSSSQKSKKRFEILVRIKTHDAGYIMPGAFLPAAERYNISTKIDQWVIDATLNWLSADHSRLKSIESCAINISGHSISNEKFLDYCVNKINTSFVPAHKICFEITETAAIANLSSARKFMSELKSKGCSFALDDFGSGLSSFGYLKNLPVDYIKIDGVFVRDLTTDPVDYEMVTAINRLGHAMDKKIIAEFVENEDILKILNEIGVDYAQGYGISKPKPIEVFTLD